MTLVLKSRTSNSLSVNIAPFEELDHLKARVAAYESVFEDEEFISKEDM